LRVTTFIKEFYDDDDDDDDVRKRAVLVADVPNFFTFPDNILSGKATLPLRFLDNVNKLCTVRKNS